jgi:7-cyano-7-deazaguanine reductase
MMANHRRPSHTRAAAPIAPAKTGQPSRADLLETFENPHPDRDYVIETICPEFTSLCPKTGQPDFGTLTISYVPDGLCFELKSLKLYLQSYRSEGAFYEDVTNRILDDLVAATRPRSMKITAAFTRRGGIRTNVHVEYSRAS